MDFIPIKCEDKISILLTLQTYIINKNYIHVLLTRMDITETMIHKHMYWYGVRNVV